MEIQRGLFSCQWRDSEQGRLCWWWYRSHDGMLHEGAEESIVDAMNAARQFGFYKPKEASCLTIV